MHVLASSFRPVPAAANVRTAALPAEATATLSDRYPDKPGAAGMPVTHVLEGEILPRPMALETLLNDPYTRLSLRSTRVVASTAQPSAPAQLIAPTVLFYQLHSSNENLSADLLGRHVNQFA